MRVILASASPRRREILARIAYPFDVIPAHVDETRRPGETPEAYVRRVADDKARRVSADHPGAAVLAADTAVLIDSELLGKPADRADAARMLAQLSGREHEVLTSVAWARNGEVCRGATTRSRVRFRPLTPAEIERYVESGEPADKAGAYAIQAGASSFIRAVAGSVTGVIGLPLDETEQLARGIGVPEVSSPLAPEAVALRWRAVSGEVAGLAVGCGRQAGDVRVIAVTKGHPAPVAAAAVGAGVADLGENYVQEAEAKRAVLGASASRVRWHLLGPLQRNKVARAVRLFDLIHTLHRADLARALAAQSTGVVRALVQVNVARDPAKSGVAPDGARALLDELRAIERLELVGLMTIGREDASPEEARATFENLRALLDALRRIGYERLSELSMGMSGDYRAAIAAGATLVRLGTAIFGPRPGVGTRNQP